MDHDQVKPSLGRSKSIGRTAEEMASYEAAHEVWPGYLIQGAASLALRSGYKDDDRLTGWLNEVALRGDGGWREWAREWRLVR